MEAKKFNEMCEQIEILTKNCREDLDPTRTNLRKKMSAVIGDIDECFEQIIMLDRIAGAGDHDIGLPDGHASIVVHDPGNLDKTNIEINMVISGKSTRRVLTVVSPEKLTQIEHADDTETLIKLIDLYREYVNDCALLNSIIKEWLDSIYCERKRVSDAFRSINGATYR